MRRAVTALVDHLPGVPSFEGPNSVCLSGLVECSYVNYERHGASTGVSLLDCVLVCKWPVHKWRCESVVHRFNFSFRRDYRVLYFKGERMVARLSPSLWF
jgi:hypothetical protein